MSYIITANQLISFLHPSDLSYPLSIPRSLFPIYFPTLPYPLPILHFLSLKSTEQQNMTPLCTCSCIFLLLQSQSDTHPGTSSLCDPDLWWHCRVEWGSGMFCCQRDKECNRERMRQRNILRQYKKTHISYRMQLLRWHLLQQFNLGY